MRPLAATDRPRGSPTNAAESFADNGLRQVDQPVVGFSHGRSRLSAHAVLEVREHRGAQLVGERVVVEHAAGRAVAEQEVLVE